MSRAKAGDIRSQHTLAGLDVPWLLLGLVLVACLVHRASVVRNLGSLCSYVRETTARSLVVVLLHLDSEPSSIQEVTILYVEVAHQDS
jgi:hypothetical protein